MKGSFLIIVLFVVAIHGQGQQPDSSLIQDTSTLPVLQPAPLNIVRPSQDSVRYTRPPAVSSNTRSSALVDTLQTASPANVQGEVAQKNEVDPFYKQFNKNPYLPLGNTPVYRIVSVRNRWSKDELFYAIAGLVLFLAFSRLVFSKYFNNIFRLFFQPTFRQKQTREQLQQSNFPSLVFNLFFIAAAGMYAALLLKHFHLLDVNFWVLFAYCSASLAVLYLGKFMFITFSGWVFNMKDAADTYIFIVYLINRIAGVVLIPFILVIAFSQSTIISVSITISLLTLISLYAYRYIVSYVPIRNDVKVSPLHFFFYVCAFEIVPLLVIYKVLMLYLNRTL